MRTKRIPSLALAAVLHLAPVCRVATVNPAIAPASFAIIARCAVAVAALLGTVDAVSGASAAVFVAGVQSLLPFAPGVTTSITRPVGSPMVLRIVLGGGVGQQPQLDYYNAMPLPPGLMINTNVNTNSVGLESTNYFIYGTPTTAGVWSPVTISAGNLLFDGLASTNISIMITSTSSASLPVITQQPHSTTVTNGSSANFTVVATGATGYQWRKGEMDLPGATSATYTIGTTTTNSAGEYSVVVSNSAGSLTSSNATLTVLDPPAIVTQPQNLTVTNGNRAIFQVVATGMPPPTYQWWFNDSPLDGATAPTLIIPSAQPADDGQDSVVVSNTVNNVRSTSAHLSVHFAPSLNNARREAGKLAFDVTGPANVNVVILTATGLTGWMPLCTNTAPNGRWHFLDTNSPPGLARFYQGMLQP